MKEKQFHGDYYSPGQGKKERQYAFSAKMFFAAIVAIVAAAAIAIIKALIFKLK